MDRGPLVSIVVPVLNEEASIGLFFDRLGPELDRALAAAGPGARAEIVFVDDGSTDATVARIAERIGGPGPVVRLVRLSRNFGKDAALTAGLAHAQGDAVIPLDVDLQDPPEVIPTMVALWRQGARVVNAHRIDRGADGWARAWSARAFYRLYNRLARLAIPADVGDFRLMDRAVVDVLNRLPERNRFMKGLVPWAGFPQARVDYVRPARAAGTSKWRFWQLWNFALDGLTASTTVPLRIWGYVGFAVAVWAILYALYVLVRTLVFGVEVPGYASLMIVTLLLGGFNMISVGILGEYIGRIAVDVRQRPLYVVAELQGFDAAPNTTRAAR